MKPPFVRSAYNYDRDEVSLRSGFASAEPSLTQQNFKDDADINTIVRRFGITGELPRGLRAPTYGDFSGIGDFQSAMTAILSAESAFMQMPAEVRDRFKNDPGLFVDFCSNPDNQAEAEKLGLVVSKPPVEAPGASAGAVATPGKEAAPKPA